MADDDRSDDHDDRSDDHDDRRNDHDDRSDDQVDDRSDDHDDPSDDHDDRSDDHDDRSDDQVDDDRSDDHDDRSDDQVDDDRSDDAETLRFEREGDVEWPVPRLFAEYDRLHGPLLAAALVASVASPLLALVPTYMLSVAIDGVLLGTEPFGLPGVPAAWLPDDRTGQLYVVAGVVVGASAANSGLAWGRFSQEVQHAVRMDAYEKVQRLGMDFFDSQQTGQILTVLNDDVNQLDRLLEQLLGDLVRIATQFLGIAAVLVALHWQLALLALAFVPVLAAISRHFVGLIRPKYEAVRGRVGELAARVENNVGGIAVIKAYATESFEADRVADASEAVYRSRWDVITTQQKFFPSMNFVNWLGFAVLLVVGGVWVTAGPPLFFTKPLSVGVLVAILAYNRQFTQPLIQVGHRIDQYYEGRASVVRVFALRDYDVEVRTPEDAVVVDDVAGRVEFDAVSFSYGSDEGTLSDVSFAVEPGTFVGVVGPTGAGKTTLVKLLLRHYDPHEGTVALDGHDLRDGDVRSLRSGIGVVSREQYLFSGTVRENVAYGRPDATDDDVERAARMANAHEFVTDFPDGYETQVGQRGVELSGGQRQRIAIAGATLEDPDLLVLDEATSHVDNETEALVQQSLSDLVADRTTFAIAHQLSTVRHADTILVMEAGRIVERGPHDALVRDDGLYADLWRMQAGEFGDVSQEFLDAHAAK